MLITDGEYVMLYNIHRVTRNIVQHAEDTRTMLDILHKPSVIVSETARPHLDMTTLHSFILHIARLFLPFYHLKTISLVQKTVGFSSFPLNCKGGRCLELTNLPPSCAECLEICEPRSSGILRVHTHGLF